jgi:hypothetical protein
MPWLSVVVDAVAVVSGAEGLAAVVFGLQAYGLAASGAVLMVDASDMVDASVMSIVRYRGDR